MPKNNKKAFYDELDRLLADQRVRNLNNFSQHNGTTTLRHVIRVAKTSFDLAERLGVVFLDHIIFGAVESSGGMGFVSLSEM